LTPHRRAFPLVPRRRLSGTPFGERRSARRGRGSDVSGTRPYVPGDPVSTIDWFASARLSSARGSDEFVVREHYAEEAPRVVVVTDRRPSMALYAEGLPWLSKPAAVAAAAEAIVRSAAQARAELGHADAAGGRTRVLSPGAVAPRHVLDRVRRAPYDAEPSSLSRTLAQLLNRRAELPQGTFVFILSDFLADVPPGTWSGLRSAHWDVVPVVVQDPIWEQSFPEIAGVLVPFTPAAAGEELLVRLTAGEVSLRRRENEIRLEKLLRRFRGAGFDPVVLGTSAPAAVDATFLRWAERRRLRRRRQ
jgi:uncharacterized protein (DUF58 family)